MPEETDFTKCIADFATFARTAACFCPPAERSVWEYFGAKVKQHSAQPSALLTKRAQAHIGISEALKKAYMLLRELSPEKR